MYKIWCWIKVIIALFVMIYSVITIYTVIINIPSWISNYKEREANKNIAAQALNNEWKAKFKINDFNELIGEQFDYGGTIYRVDEVLPHRANFRGSIRAVFMMQAALRIKEDIKYVSFDYFYNTRLMENNQ